jgi:hypothetical protein
VARREKNCVFPGGGFQVSPCERGTSEVAAQPIEIVTSTSGDACDVSNYLRRRRPRIDPLAWGRFRVRVRGVLPWKRLFASLSRSRNLSAAVLLLSLFIVDPFDATREAPQAIGENH